MRKVLYLNRLNDGAVAVSVYTGEAGMGTLKEYGVRSPELVDRIRKFAEKFGEHSEHGSFSIPNRITDVYELNEAERKSNL